MPTSAAVLPYFLPARHHVYLLPPMAAPCNFVGWGYLGCDGSIACRAWIGNNFWTQPAVRRRQYWARMCMLAGAHKWIACPLSAANLFVRPAVGAVTVASWACGQLSHPVALHCLRHPTKLSAASPAALVHCRHWPMRLPTASTFSMPARACLMAGSTLTPTTAACRWATQPGEVSACRQCAATAQQMLPSPATPVQLVHPSCS